MEVRSFQELYTGRRAGDVSPLMNDATAITQIAIRGFTSPLAVDLMVARVKNSGFEVAKPRKVRQPGEIPIHGHVSASWTRRMRSGSAAIDETSREQPVSFGSVAQPPADSGRPADYGTVACQSAGGIPPGIGFDVIWRAARYEPAGTVQDNSAVCTGLFTQAARQNPHF